jgi:GNAT superfamily N-acetyltransferase
MPTVQLLNHADPAVAAQVLAVLRPAAAQEAGWLGLPQPDPPAARRAAGAEPERTVADDVSDDVADICASTQVYLGAWLGPVQGPGWELTGVAEASGGSNAAGPAHLAGVLSLAPDDDEPDRLCIALLVVAPWAQRRGLGRALVLAALQRGQGRGFSVTAARANAVALALYGSLGFVPGRTGLLGAARLPVVQLWRAPEAATMVSSAV